MRRADAAHERGVVEGEARGVVADHDEVVARAVHLGEGEGHRRAPALGEVVDRADGVDRAEVGGDRGVVGRGVRERLLHQAEARREREPAAGGAEFGEQRRVVGGVRDGRHADEVLRGGADHAGAADVDVRAAVLGRDAGLRGDLLEGVEVADHHVDLDGAGAREVRLVGVVVVLAEQAEVDLEVERLDEPALHLGLAGVVGDLHEAVLRGVAERGGERLVGAAGAEEADAGAGFEEPLGEVLDASLVEKAGEDVADGDEVVDLGDVVEGHGSLEVRG